MYSAACVELALSHARAGDAGPGAFHGAAGNPACGDAVRIGIRIDAGRVAAARHRTFACPHATAAAELACRLAEGRDLLDAARVGRRDLDERIDAPEAARECTDLAIDALHAALAAAVAGARLEAVPGRVAVAMSGGVDSAVALTKAIAAGLSPVGVTLRLWVDPEAPNGERACCSPQAVRSARDTCHRLGVPHLAIDLRDEFRHAVVDDFVAAHAAGRTPNPCMRCNGAFRFAAIAEVADRIGAERIATGHYARIERRAGTVLVARGADPAEDQSYMLASVPSEILERCWFPLGDQTKVETRAQAQAAGLAAAGAAESQEVCFVGGGDHRGARRAPGRCRPLRRDRRLDGSSARHPRRAAPVHARPAPGPRAGRRRCRLRPSYGARDRPCRRGEPRGAGADLGAGEPRAHVRAGSAGEGEAAVPPERGLGDRDPRGRRRLRARAR